ncbi:MAG: protein kinase [Pseudomonadota bacterium]
MNAPPTNPEALSPDLGWLAHYQLRRRLGEGGFGQVFEAWDSKLCRSIAIKQLKSLSQLTPPGSLIQEARAAASLKHQAFVQIFSIDGDGEAQSIVMELVDGQTLRELTRPDGQQRAIDTKQALDIVQQIADAMQEAHASGLIHGDLKPSNLMLEASGKVRILDFGLARQMDPLATESTSSIDSQGTIAYMAPERLLGQPAAQQSDIYSLGVVLYELINGARPFAELNGLALAAAHIQSTSSLWPFPAGTDPRIIALIIAMTAREPAQRLASMQAVQQAIISLQDPAGILTLPNSLPAAERVKPARSRMARRLLLWGMGTLLVVAVVALGVYQSKAYTEWANWIPKPYSEAKAMQAGLEALRTFDRDGSLDNAIRNFNSILEHAPNHAGAAAGLSLAYSLRYANDGRDEAWLQRADASAQQALKENDQLALAHAAQAWVRGYQKRMDEALATMDKAINLDPLNHFAIAGKIRLLIQMHRFDAAEISVQNAIKIHPKERQFVDLLGTLRFQQGDYPAAERAFKRSTQLEPDATFAYANLGATLLRQNRGDEALQALQQGLQIRPSGVLYSNLGHALFARGDYVAAAQAFEHAVSAAKGSPNNYLKWANLADALRWIPGRSEESRKAYQQAIELLKPVLERSPNDTTVLSRMGLYAAKLGNRQATVWTQHAVANAPSNADVHFRGAVAYEVIGSRDLALAEITKARALAYPINLINAEPDLIALRRDPRYHNLTMESQK